MWISTHVYADYTKYAKRLHIYTIAIHRSRWSILLRYVKKMCLFLDQWSDLIITFDSLFLLKIHQTYVIKTCKCFTSETVKSDRKLLNSTTVLDYLHQDGGFYSLVPTTPFSVITLFAAVDG